ncbi:hypothetical protein V8J36_17985 [Frigidibacter sp. MR17.14]|uniref:hypothetical protein n=1 Tax=Frigidibacter sp. MR17.14 TaxID=3126509 RepID=UPI003012D98E
MRVVLFFFTGPVWARLVSVAALGWFGMAMVQSRAPHEGIAWQSSAEKMLSPELRDIAQRVLAALIEEQKAVMVVLALLVAVVCGLRLMSRRSLPKAEFDVRKHDEEMPAVTLLVESRGAALARRTAAQAEARALVSVEKLALVAACVLSLAIAVITYFLRPEQMPLAIAVAVLLVLPLALPSLREALAARLARVLRLRQAPPDDLPDPFDRILAERVRRSAPVSHRYRT